MESERFTVLGIHEDTARVRMFVGSEVIDEDYALPPLPPGVTPSEAVYLSFLRSDIETRMTQLEQNTAAVGDDTSNQLITENPYV